MFVSLFIEDRSQLLRISCLSPRPQPHCPQGDGIRGHWAFEGWVPEDKPCSKRFSTFIKDAHEAPLPSHHTRPRWKERFLWTVRNNFVVYIKKKKSQHLYIKVAWRYPKGCLLRSSGPWIHVLLNKSIYRWIYKHILFGRGSVWESEIVHSGEKHGEPGEGGLLSG